MQDLKSKPCVSSFLFAGRGHSHSRSLSPGVGLRLGAQCAAAQAAEEYALRLPLGEYVSSGDSPPLMHYPRGLASLLVVLLMGHEQSKNCDSFKFSLN